MAIMVIRWKCIAIIIMLTKLLCFKSVFCCGNLIANLNSHSIDPDSPLKLISYCIDCPSPDREGTIIYGLLPRHGVKEYFISAQVVYCIPNLADSDILNDEQFTNRIVIVDRGGITLFEKIFKIQEAGALGIIIADDGQCNEQFSYCGPRVGSVREGGFAPHDHFDKMWRVINIPVLLISLKTAEHMRRLMPVERIFLPKMGYHNMTVLTNADGSREEL